MKRPDPSEYGEFYKRYISLVKEGDIFQELEMQILQLQTLISAIPLNKEKYIYAPGKWTIREVVGHIIDVERLMSYRALRISRKDKTMLSGFDDEFFVANSNFNERTLQEQEAEFSFLRNSNIVMIRSFTEEMLCEMGNANGKDVSVRSLVYIMAGHVTHHMNVIREKYLSVK